MENGKKPKAESASILAGVKFLNPQDEAGIKELPILYDLLCPRWKAGYLVRQPGRLSIRVEGGSYYVSLDCPQEGVSTLISVENLTTALQDVETVLRSGTMKWVASWARKKKSLPTIDEPIE